MEEYPIGKPNIDRVAYLLLCTPPHPFFPDACPLLHISAHLHTQATLLRQCTAALPSLCSVIFFLVITIIFFRATCLAASKDFIKASIELIFVYRHGPLSRSFSTAPITHHLYLSNIINTNPNNTTDAVSVPNVIVSTASIISCLHYYICKQVLKQSRWYLTS